MRESSAWYLLLLLFLLFLLLLFLLLLLLLLMWRLYNKADVHLSQALNLENCSIFSAVFSIACELPGADIFLLHFVSMKLQSICLIRFALLASLDAQKTISFRIFPVLVFDSLNRAFHRDNKSCICSMSMLVCGLFESCESSNKFSDCMYIGSGSIFIILICWMCEQFLRSIWLYFLLKCFQDVKIQLWQTYALDALKRLPPSLSKSLSLTFQKLLIKGAYPTQWKINEVVSLFKYGDKIQINRYLPINIRTCLSIVLEKLLFEYIC